MSLKARLANISYRTDVALGLETEEGVLTVKATGASL